MVKRYKMYRVPEEFDNVLQKLKIVGVINNKQDMLRKLIPSIEDGLNKLLESEAKRRRLRGF